MGSFPIVVTLDLRKEVGGSCITLSISPGQQVILHCLDTCGDFSFPLRWCTDAALVTMDDEPISLMRPLLVLVDKWAAAMYVYDWDVHRHIRVSFMHLKRPQDTNSGPLWMKAA